MTPKGFYFNRGVFYFGRKVEGDMARAEEQIRQAHKRGKGTERLVTGARLAALERNLGIPIKRHRDPSATGPQKETPDHTTQDEKIFIKAE